MAETLIVQGQNREEKYISLLPQLRALTEGENDLIANVANIVAALKETFAFFWIGVYFVKGDQLVLGPFQGPIACTRISKGKGVCGASWAQKKIFVVEDVDQFPGHIACSSLSKSEIVLPVFDQKNEVVMVIDVDSDKLADFNDTDKQYLGSVAGLLSEIYDRR